MVMTVEKKTNYPLPASAPDTIAMKRLDQHVAQFLESPFPALQRADKPALHSYFLNYIDIARSHFQLEEDARKKGVNGANLTYHGKEHAVYQVTDDLITGLEITLQRKNPSGQPDELSKHITLNGVVAALTAPPAHDIGYVYGVPIGENFAARTPIHVKESMKAYGELIDTVGVPDGCQKRIVKLLGTLAIHATNFPYTKEHEKEAQEILAKLPPELRKEAQIIRLLVQFADLGGQCARVDYFPDGVKNLREEMNAANEGKGTETIGTDEEIATKAGGFITYVVEKTVGRKGQAILKEGMESYVNRWSRVKNQQLPK